MASLSTAMLICLFCAILVLLSVRGTDGALSALQNKKLDFLFKTYFDANQDGSIGKDDIDIIQGILLKLNSWSVDSAHKASLKKRLLEDVWNEIKSEAISGKKHSGFLQKYPMFVFDTMDQNGDGKLDQQEYVETIANFGIAAAQAKNAFKKLTSGSSSLAKDAGKKRFVEFYSSDDVTSPGNYLFGSKDF